MAVTSSEGYEGSVGYDTHAQISGKGSKYSVESAGALAPTVAVADRTITLAAGPAIGCAIRDVLTATDVEFDTVLSGVRYDMVVLRRDWSANETTVEVVEGGTSSSTLPERNVGAGVLDDQPIALVRVTAGSTEAEVVADLRCWAGSGGLVATSDLALQYLTEPGTRVLIGSTEHTRRVVGGSPQWFAAELGDLSDTGWQSSNAAFIGSTGNRRWRRKNGEVTFQAQGTRTAAAASGYDAHVMTFADATYRPTQTAYGVCWVGSTPFRAYCTVTGEVHVDPFTIAPGQGFQIQIQWPV